MQQQQRVGRRKHVLIQYDGSNDSKSSKLGEGQAKNRQQQASVGGAEEEKKNQGTTNANGVSCSSTLLLSFSDVAIFPEPLDNCAIAKKEISAGTRIRIPKDLLLFREKQEEEEQQGQQQEDGE
mmetsp:Transcript_23039/g.44946  ORF Transcript_23039/g.44946 Transcript_23039/m.44946 type:complete len:124 (-) Transcript_23039:7-378(-)